MSTDETFVQVIKVILGIIALLVIAYIADTMTLIDKKLNENNNLLRTYITEKFVEVSRDRN